MTLSQTEQNEAIALLQRLVQAPSLSGNEKRAAEVAAAQMRAMDFDRVWFDDYGSVIGMRRGGLPGPTLVFEGHMDEVDPGDVNDWSDNPFSGALKDGKIHGRGASDTKGSLAGMIIAVGGLPRSQMRGTLYVVGTVCEEFMEGTSLRKVLEVIKADGVVVGEPTDCRLAIGQKGRARLLFTAHGRPAHSSTPKNGENAVLKAGEILRRVEAMPLPENQWLGRAEMVPLQVTSKPEPPVTSIVPYQCQIYYDRRLVADETEAGMLAEYRAALADLPGWDVALDTISHDFYTGRTITEPDFRPSWMMDEHSPWVETAVAALKQAGIEPGVHTVPYCADGSGSAGVLGLPTLLFGPSSILLAHITNEYILVDEYLRSIEGYRALALALPGAFQQ